MQQYSSLSEHYDHKKRVIIDYQFIRSPLTQDSIFTSSPITHYIRNKELFRVYTTGLLLTQERRDFVTEVQQVKHDLWLSGYLKHLVDATVNIIGNKK
jgi:hypothetical protein